MPYPRVILPRVVVGVKRGVGPAGGESLVLGGFRVAFGFTLNVGVRGHVRHWEVGALPPWTGRIARSDLEYSSPRGEHT